MSRCRAIKDAWLPRVRGLASATFNGAAKQRLGAGVKPLSYCRGFDRGLPIHRYYLEQFLREHRGDIRGHCLEFQSNSYTRNFGGWSVSRADILDIDRSNRAATLVADLTRRNDLRCDQFDCIICTHVLHVISELDSMVNELYRILKPGGVLLVAVPHVSMCDPEQHELWRFAPRGLELILARVFHQVDVQVRAYGNSLTAAGEIRGLVSSEFSRAELDTHDSRFAVEVCARALKRTLL